MLQHDVLRGRGLFELAQPSSGFTDGSPVPLKPSGMSWACLEMAVDVSPGMLMRDGVYGC